MPGRKGEIKLLWLTTALTGLQTDAPMKHVQNKVLVQESLVAQSIHY